MATSKSFPDHLLRLQAIHQRLHRYVPHHDFVRGVDSVISNRLSRSRYLTDAASLAHMDASNPQELPWRLWNSPREIVSTITFTLWRTTSPRDSLIVEPIPLMGTGLSGPSSVVTCTSNPYSSCTRIWSLSSTHLQGSTGEEPLPPADVNYDTACLRTPYDRLYRRSLLWVSQTPASQVREN